MSSCLHISAKREPGGIMAVVPILAAYKKLGGHDGYARLVRCLVMGKPPGTGNEVGAAGDGQLMSAVAKILAAWPDIVDDDRLSRAIGNQSIEDLRASAKAMSGDSQTGKIAVRLVEIYHTNACGPTIRKDGPKALKLTPRGKIPRASTDPLGDDPDADRRYPWQRGESEVHYEKLRAGDLYVQIPGFQRNPEDRRKWLAEGQRAFNPVLQQTLDVWRRDTGELFVLDGLGRVFKKVEIEGDSDYLFGCNVHTNIGDEEAACALFETLNSARKAVSPVMLYLANRSVGIGMYVDIDKVLAQYELPNSRSEDG